MDDKEIRGTSVIHSKETLAQQDAHSQEGEENVERWESLSEEARRRTSRWKWERDDQN